MFNNYSYYQMNGYYQQYPGAHVSLFPPVVRKFFPKGPKNSLRYPRLNGQSQWFQVSPLALGLLYGTIHPAQMGQLTGGVLSLMGGAPAYGIGTILHSGQYPSAHLTIYPQQGVYVYPPQHPLTPTPIHQQQSQ